MWVKGTSIRTLLIVLLTLSVLAGGFLSPSTYPVAADDLPLREESPVPSASADDYVPDEIIVKFKAGILSATENQLHASLGTSVVHTSPHGGFKVLKIPSNKTVAEMVEAYSRQPAVEYAEPNYRLHITWSPDDPGYSYQWHFPSIDVAGAWDLDTTPPLYGGDPSIVVAVIDSGVAYETYSSYVQAPDLASTNFWTNPGETAGNGIDDDGNGYTDDIHGWDFVNSDAHPNDDNRHGTHVTGTIAQSTNNSLGVAGIAFNTTIMPLKVLDENGDGSDAWVADAIYYAVNNGANIINMSLGGSSSSSTLQNAVAYAANAGVVVIAAMGNTGDNVTQYPAGYDAYVIAVAATRYDQTRSYYSTYGPNCDIAAPGGDTTPGNDQNGDGYVDGVLQQTFASGDPTSFSYYFFQGTSMATPHVAGVAALILAKNPTWTAAQVRHALEHTATDKGATGRDDYYGWGLINAQSSVGFTLSPAASFSDAGHSTPCDDFDNYTAEHTVYIYAIDLHPNQSYRVAYYDGGDTKRATEDVTSGSSGNVSSQHTFNKGTDVAGTWHVIICEPYATPPNSYNGTWAYTITSDSFVVQDTAIPEFSTATAVAATLALCLGIYLWRRRSLVKVRA